MVLTAVQVQFTIFSMPSLFRYTQNYIVRHRGTDKKRVHFFQQND